MWKPSARYLYEVAIRADNQTAYTWMLSCVKVSAIYRNRNKHVWILRKTHFGFYIAIYLNRDTHISLRGVASTPKEAYRKVNRIARQAFLTKPPPKRKRLT